jgi:hypothetical protein
MKKYFIIKIRIYASPYYLKKFHNQETIGLLKQHDAGKKWVEFKQKFVKFVSNKPMEYWYGEYGFSAIECALEEIQETHKIKFFDAGAFIHIYIPVDCLDIIEWVMSNVGDIPYKVLKRGVSFWEQWPSDVETWRRESYRLPENSVLRKVYQDG